MTYALLLGFFRNNFGFGGNNGLTDFKDILGFNVQAEATRNSLLVISCLVLAICFLICRAIVTSKFGKVLVAIRDAEARTRFLGYRVEAYKLFVFTLSACMAGVAGALYVPQVGIINPSEFAPGQFDRSRDLGRGRRPRHADRRGARRLRGQLRQDLFHLRRSGALLAVHAGRPVHRHHLADAARHHRHLQQLARATAPRKKTRRCRTPRRTRRSRAHDRFHDRIQDRHADRCDNRQADHVRAALSRRHQRVVRRLQGAQRIVVRRRAGRDARHHRTERRRQDHHDGRDHRQDAARLRRRVFPGRHLRPFQARRNRDRHARHRPQVPEADRVRDAHGRGQSAIWR